MKNIQKINKLCYCLGEKFKPFFLGGGGGGGISPPKGPEKTLCWREMLHSGTYLNMVVFVVDEAHCVEKVVSPPQKTRVLCHLK